MKILHLGHFYCGAYCDDIIRICTENIIKKINPEVMFKSRLDLPSLEIQELIQHINENFDMMIFGGGSLLGKLRFPPFDKIEQWYDKLKIPLILFAPGWRQEDEFDSKDFEQMRLLLETASMIGVRGNETLTRIKEHTLPSHKVQVTGDPVLSFDRISTLEEQMNTQFIAGNVRNISLVELQQDIRTVENDFMYGRLSFIYEYMMKKLPYCKLNFYSFTDDNHAYMKKFSDFKSAIETIKLIERDKEAIYNYRTEFNQDEDLIEYASRLGQAKMIISQRLHPQILGIVQGVPIIPIEYQFDKMKDCLSVGFDTMKSLLIQYNELGIEKVKKIYKKLTDVKLMKENKMIVEKYREIQDNFWRKALI